MCEFATCEFNNEVRQFLESDVFGTATRLVVGDYF